MRALIAPMHQPTWTSCDDCKHRKVAEVEEFVDLKAAKKMKALGKRLGMNGDKFEETGKWLRISWSEPRCNISKQLTFPDGVWHNCHLVNLQENNAEDNWWE